MLPAEGPSGKFSADPPLYVSGVPSPMMLKSLDKITVVHDFNGHEVNGIHGLYGKKGYDKAL